MDNLHSSFQFQMTRRIFRQEVPVHFDGTVWLVKNVTKYTTCSDVVHMLLLKSGLSVDRISFYTLFETTGDLERMLSGRTRIMRTLRSWGCEKDNFRCVLGKIEEDNHCRLIRYRDIRNSPSRTKFYTISPGLHQELDMNTRVNSINNDCSVRYNHEKVPKQKDFGNAMKGADIRFINIKDKLHLPGEKYVPF